MTEKQSWSRLVDAALRYHKTCKENGIRTSPRLDLALILIARHLEEKGELD